MSKPFWACPSCGADFTRKTSAIRHINNLHDGSIYSIFPIPYTDYLAGRQSGLYPSVTPTRLGMAKRTVADSTRGRISNVKGTGSISTAKASVSTAAFNTPMSDPVAEAVRNFLNVRNLMLDTGTVSPTMNVINAVPVNTWGTMPIGYLEGLKLPNSNNNSNHIIHRSQQIGLHELYQFVDARPWFNSPILVFRWDNFEPEHFKNLMPPYTHTLKGGFLAP